MATLESIAIRNEQALARLQANVAALSERFQVEPPDIPDGYRDARELPTMQLEVLAAWTETVVNATKEQSHDET
jgi:hypothetical protein